MPDRSQSCNLQYLRTPLGAVKVVNVLFGTTSLILVAASYVRLWTLGVFIGTVAICLLLSLLYLPLYMFASPAVVHSKGNRVASFLFHVLSGTALIVAGIELIGWSEYRDPSCTHDCPRLYTVGIAKTLTFMNGVLYLIVGFLGIKDDDLLDPDAADENMPLLKSTILTSIPGGKPGTPKATFYYDPFFRHSKYPYDTNIRPTNVYRIQRPPNSYPREYSFNNSYAASATTYGGIRLIPAQGVFVERDAGSSNSSIKNVAYSMTGGNDEVDLRFYKE